MSEDPFSDPPTILEPPAPRGRTTSRAKISENMEPEIQEVRIVDLNKKSSRSAAAGSNGAAPPVPPKKRSQSQDNVLQAAAAAEKARAAKQGKANKKGGLHVDVIDRLDWSGVGPATFHHDGPFDACAPSRNRHKMKAPMLAWTPNQDPQIEANGVLGAPPPPKPTRAPPVLDTIDNMGTNDSPYGAAATSPTSRKKKSGLQEDFKYPRRPASPKRRDTLADAWGRGEPEPFEEFFAESVIPAAVGHGEGGMASAASSIYKDKTGHGDSSSSGKNGRRTNGGVRRATNRPPLPPPQPIFPESTPMAGGEEEPFSSDLALSSSAGGGPRRSKSLMQRIKKMRDAPNVPVDYDEPTYDQSGSSSENHMGANRPTHRQQNSILGRLGNRSPTSPGFGDSPGEKALPGIPPSSVSPGDNTGNGYFENRGVGRKASIMQKVRGVVVGKNR